MKQRGSKYDQKIKDEALALVASGVSITNAAIRMRLPKSTLADWVHTQNEGDEDGIAIRREIRRRQITRCEKIGDKVLQALARKADAAAKDTKAINDGLSVLEKGGKGRCDRIERGRGGEPENRYQRLYRRWPARAGRNDEGCGRSAGDAGGPSG